MNFQPTNIYHIYNQGNNRQVIFNTHEDYSCFLNLLKTTVLPHCNLIAFCLMPNHFHLMIHTDDRCSIKIKQGNLFLDTITNGIRKLLSSYTRIYNSKNNRSGNLFRQKTKAKNITEINIENVKYSRLDYYFTCFNYIHRNPVAAALVNNLEDWHYSSYLDYLGMREDALINKKIAEEYGMYNIKTFKTDTLGDSDNDMIKLFSTQIE